MSAPSYARNDEQFVAFYSAQRRLVACLARRPDTLGRWLASKPRCGRAQANATSPSRTWRAARLTLIRRRELAALIDRVVTGAAPAEELAGWLLAATPVSSYLEMIALARAGSADAELDDCARETVALRDELFDANYGLAKFAALRRRGLDFADGLSAACAGLLDAVDRYVPGERASRFSYFANYWIRYHLSRQSMKHGCVVSVPINHHREDRRNAAVPGAAREPARRFPEVLSLDEPPADGGSGSSLQRVLRDPAPGPSDDAGAGDFDERVALWLRGRLPPATRVMLAYGHGVGALPQAAVEYVEQLAAAAWERVAAFG